MPSLIKMKKEGTVSSLATLIAFDPYPADLNKEAADCGIKIYHYNDIVEAGKNAPRIMLNEPNAESIYMFCYTSGTTGDPKAAMLTHRNFISVAAGVTEQGVVLNENDITISYLPLAHSFEKSMFVAGVMHGCSCGFYSGDPLKLLDDMKALKPTIFASVPRLFNRIYDRILAGLKEKSYFKQYLFNKAITSKKYYLEH